MLDYLYELQQLDTQLGQLESLRGDLPGQVNRLKGEYRTAESTLNEYSEKLEALIVERGLIDVEISDLEAKQKKYQEQLFNVKNNKEYDAVTHEIENVKQNIGLKESRVIELIDLVEETKNAIEAQKIHVAEMKTRLNEKQEELQKRMASTEKEEAALQDRRGKVLRHLEDRVVSMYERIRKAKNGLAVVPVARGACGGCYKSLPPQRILEIRQKDRLFLCEVCGRMLVWDEAASQGGS